MPRHHCDADVASDNEMAGLPAVLFLYCRGNHQRMSAQLRQIDSTIDVVTPENISFQYEVAGPFRRLPAFLIDVVLRFAIAAAFMIALMFMNEIIRLDSDVVLALGLLLWFALEWFYGGVLETYWNGQTIGKKIVGLRVLSVDGQPINGLQAMMRNLLRLADMMPLIPIGALFGWGEGPWIVPTCMLGLVVPVLNRRFQRLGDLVCGTMVVVEHTGWRASTTQIDGRDVRRWAEELPVSLVMTRKMSQALAAYVERRRYLNPARRQEIARHLAVPLVRQWNLPHSLDPDTLLCALYYRHFVTTNARTDPDPANAVTMATLAEEG